jgi:hypothetical protein
MLKEIPQNVQQFHQMLRISVIAGGGWDVGHVQCNMDMKNEKYIQMLVWDNEWKRPA